MTAQTKLEQRLAEIRWRLSTIGGVDSAPVVADYTFLLALVAEYERALNALAENGYPFKNAANTALANAERLAGGEG